ncbi:MAG: ABC transporter ATP-binding protein [Oscillospiraceae bacterium]|nr:ABC transporter ATP-binding protein [Oscillospiraceae bacterium]
MSEQILQVEHLQKRYQDKDVLKDVTLALETGTATALVGPHGAGKTTLIRILAGMAFPDGGSISLFGSRGEEELRQARQRAGFLVDAPFGKSGFNVEKNLLLLAGLYGKPDKRYIRRLMKRLQISEKEIGTQRVGQLLKIVQARYAIATVLVNKPRLLILDEPMTELHTDDLETVCSLLNELREEGTALLLTGRDVKRLRLVCSQAMLLHEGALTGPVPIEELTEEG